MGLYQPRGSLVNFAIRTAFLVMPTLCLGFAAPAHALPFKSDCASMARFAKVVFNRDKAAVERYDFTGFKGELTRIEGYPEVYCENGYTIESSPKGKLVCESYILYNTSDGYLTHASGNYSKEVEAITRRNAIMSKFGPEREAAEIRDRYMYAGKENNGPPCRWQ